MARHRKRFLLVAAAVGVLQLPLARAQAPASPLTFEVASIKPSSADTNSSSGIGTQHGRLHAENVTLKRCIMGAYGIGPREIIGGPDWLDLDRFEIVAKTAQLNEGDAVLMEMLKNLMAERFKLALHRETRMLPAYLLEVANKGPKVVTAEAGEAVTSTSHNNSRAGIDAHNVDMNGLARTLARELKMPVVNQTKLEGIFNFKLQWTPDTARNDPESVSLFTAIQEQLGLRLRSEKTPVEVLVIDRVEKPSAN